MANVHRRDVLAGFAAGVAVFPALIGRGAAAMQTEPPSDGPLSASAVGDLLKRHNVPGASLAILDKGELVASFCYGFAQAGRPVTPQTRFQAASISKTANALAVLKLVEAGRLRLDDPVNTHLKTWKLPDNALTAKTPVTVRMLLSHTGGTTVPGFAGYIRGTPLPTLQQVLDGERPANSAAVRVEWMPGEAFRYSGGGTTILQQMVIDVTGEDYAAVLDRLVLRPLEMAESNYDQTPDAGALQEAALAHGPNGTLNPGGFRVHPELAAAGLWTTPRDLVRVVLAIIRSRNGGRGAFFEKQLARQMLTPVAADSGLGAFIDEKGVFHHPGSNIGYRALYVGDPETGQGMSVMTNGDNGEEPCMVIRRRVAQVYGWR